MGKRPVRDYISRGVCFFSTQLSASRGFGGAKVVCRYQRLTCSIGILAPFGAAKDGDAGIRLVVRVTASRGATITNTARALASNVQIQSR